MDPDLPPDPDGKQCGSPTLAGTVLNTPIAEPEPNRLNPGQADFCRLTHDTYVVELAVRDEANRLAYPVSEARANR